MWELLVLWVGLWIGLFRRSTEAFRNVSVAPFQELTHKEFAAEVALGHLPLDASRCPLIGRSSQSYCLNPEFNFGESHFENFIFVFREIVRGSGASR